MAKNGIFAAPQFNNDDAAREYLESILWPDGPTCPHCGVVNHAYKTKRAGVYRCAEKQCRKDFTVTMKTVMERSHIALHKWLQGFHLMASSKKGVSAHQLHRTLAITYEAAWFMAHRIREAMRAGGLAPFGSTGGAVEVDETFIGREPGTVMKGGGVGHKMKVLSLVDRESGHARSMVVDDLRPSTILPILAENIAKEARVMTDEARYYRYLEDVFASHETVNHGTDEYVRGEAHTNTIEGYFSIFKRGMRGIYQHCGKQHLHRYLSEYDFRYNHRSALGVNDGERAALAVKGAAGKRLTYRGPH